MLATRDAFGVQLLKSSQKNDNIVVLSADLSKPTRTEKFAKEFPDRFFEIGIAESNMIGIGSGLSEYGFKVVMTSFATFLTGKYDVIRVSLAYSNSPVILVGTHGGLAIGKDGVITINEISDCGTEIKNAVEKAINKINKWEIGFVDGNPVDVILITDLKIEK